METRPVSLLTATYSCKIKVSCSKQQNVVNFSTLIKFYFSRFLVLHSAVSYQYIYLIMLVNHICIRNGSSTLKLDNWVAIYIYIYIYIYINGFNFSCCFYITVILDSLKAPVSCCFSLMH